MLFEALSIVLAIFLMILAGLLLTHLKLFDERAEDLLSTLVVKVGLPAMIISNVMTKFTRETLLASLGPMLVPFAAMILSYVAAIPLARLLRVPQRRRGAFYAMITFSNTVFIGVPVSLALFGEDALSITLLSYIANTVLFWTIGVAGLRADGGQARVRVLSLETLKRLCTLPLLTFLGCVALVLIGVALPSFVMQAAGYLGNLVTPCSMLFTGAMLYRMGWKRFRVDLSQIAMLLGRFVLSPGIVLALSLAFGLDPLVRNVFVMQASMPVMSQTAILAKAYGADAEYTTVGTALALVCSLVLIPLYRVLLNLI